MNATAPAIAHLPEADGRDVQQQDLPAFLQAHRGSLKSFLHKRLSNEADVEDAAQEVMLRLYAYAGQNTVDSAQALLYHIAARVAADFRRRARTHRTDAHYPLDDVPLLSQEASPEQLKSAEQDLEQLVDALERLSAKCQNVFILNRMDGLSYAQIAQRCGISVKMVEKYMSRALAELRAEVGGWSDAAP